MNNTDYTPIKRRKATEGKSLLSHINEMKKSNRKPRKKKKIEDEAPRKLVVRSI